MKANSVGAYFKENYLRESFLLNSGEPLVTITPSLDHVDGIGMIIVAEEAVRVITANGTTDNVDASSKTWVFAAGTFGDGDVGAAFVIANSAEGNDGSYVIATVVNATTVTSVGSPVADETFDDTVTMTLTDDPLQAEVTFEVSNDYSKSGGLELAQIPNPGHWADITDQFSPAPTAITDDTSQYIQAYPLVARRGRLTITPSAGASLVTVTYCAKGTR